MPLEARLLIPFCQKYDWGKIGSASMVAQLARSGVGIEIDESIPYAELWMGDHPNGPCYIEDQEKGSVTIKEYLSSVSIAHIEFLFKVLSVRKALSIQSHPDGALARTLHAKFPNIYKDPNPKPELAIALTPFRALFGFRQVDEIVGYTRKYKDLARLVGERNITDLDHMKSGEALKRVYSMLMHASSTDVNKTIDSVISKGDDDEAVNLARNLNRDFPNDVGVLSVFFLNIVDLVPGQAIYMGPNVPHAYVSGDLIECMTCSDNVIRGGLTPKFKDVETLVTSLDYTCSKPVLLDPCFSPEGFPTWSPGDVPFAVTEYIVNKGSSCVINGKKGKGPSIALVIEGSGVIGSLSVKKGQTALLPPGDSHLVVSSEGLRIFEAFTPN